MESIKFEHIHQWGVITLQKRSTLNALDFEMILSIRAFLEACLNDHKVSAILIKSGVSNVFSAGGDVKTIYRWHVENDHQSPDEFIQHEYGLNAYLQSYSKPVVAIMDGLTLGGGVGLTQYAKYRIATTNAVIGMPEIKIAFFPDVGAGYFLNLLDQSLARFLSLTGYLLKGSDLITTGYATHLVEADEVSDLINRILSEDPNNLKIVLPQSVAIPSKLNELAVIIECFRASSLVESLENLKQSTHPSAQKFYVEMLAFSPLALHIIWRYMNETRGLPYASVVQIELVLATRMFHDSDIFEGIRTRLIDKGATAKWRHQSISDVSPKEVETFFV
jgi:enoyl-CoA hydratase